MNQAVTSKEEIIAACQQIAKEQGLEAISMRSVASKCGMAVGSVYNYFPSKSELLCATIENIWKDIFHMSASQCAFSDFVECLTWLFDSVQRGSQMYPEFFSRHAMIFASEDQIAGHQMMEKYFRHLEVNLLKYCRETKRSGTMHLTKCLPPNYLSAMCWNCLSPLYFIFRKTTAESSRFPPLSLCFCPLTTMFTTYHVLGSGSCRWQKAIYYT